MIPTKHRLSAVREETVSLVRQLQCISRMFGYPIAPGTLERLERKRDEMDAKRPRGRKPYAVMLAMPALLRYLKRFNTLPDSDEAAERALTYFAWSALLRKRDMRKPKSPPSFVSDETFRRSEKLKQWIEAAMQDQGDFILARFERLSCTAGSGLTIANARANGSNHDYDAGPFEAMQVFFTHGAILSNPHAAAHIICAGNVSRGGSRVPAMGMTLRGLDLTIAIHDVEVSMPLGTSQIFRFSH